MSLAETASGTTITSHRAEQGTRRWEATPALAARSMRADPGRHGGGFGAAAQECGGGGEGCDGQLAPAGFRNSGPSVAVGSDEPLGVRCLRRPEAQPAGWFE